MTSLAAAVAQFRKQGHAEALQSAIPYLEHLGARFFVEDADVIGHLPFAPGLVGNHMLPALHGGALASFLEATAVATILYRSGKPLLPKIVDSNIDYLRSAKPIDTYAKSTIIKQGRRVINIQTVGWQDEPDRPVTVVRSHFLLRPWTE